jgi:hypothetical protein
MQQQRILIGPQTEETFGGTIVAPLRLAAEEVRAEGRMRGGRGVHFCATPAGEAVNQFRKSRRTYSSGLPGTLSAAAPETHAMLSRST